MKQLSLYMGFVWLALAACNPQDIVPDPNSETEAGPPPIVTIIADSVALPERAFTLAGKATSSLSNSLLRYQWSVRGKPAFSTATFSYSQTPEARFTPDLSGNYQLLLEVTDRCGKVGQAVHNVTVR